MLDFFDKGLHCMKSVRIWIFSGPYSIRMQKVRTRKTTNDDTFHAVPKTYEKALLNIQKHPTMYPPRI